MKIDRATSGQLDVEEPFVIMLGRTLRAYSFVSIVLVRISDPRISVTSDQKNPGALISVGKILKAVAS